ncbi:MAG TPA: hypothetical protein PKU98_07535 [Saprospiraceae bacterium]|nr:hypothetical protein [Saprospiraceae bacterium]
MRFVRDNLAVFFDGQSNLYLAEIVNRSSSRPEEWKIVFSWTVPAKNESPSVLKDAILFENSLHIMQAIFI